MTNPSHTELASLADEFKGRADDCGRLARAVLAALESPERVRGRSIAERITAKIESMNPEQMVAFMQARERLKAWEASESTPPTAPDQDAQWVSDILDALRVGRVACEWAEKTAEVQQIAAAMEIAKSMLSATPPPQAEKQPLSEADEALMLADSLKNNTSIVGADRINAELRRQHYRIEADETLMRKVLNLLSSLPWNEGYADDTDAAITALRARLETSK